MIVLYVLLIVSIIFVMWSKGKKSIYYIKPSVILFSLDTPIEHPTQRQTLICYQSNHCSWWEEDSMNHKLWTLPSLLVSALCSSQSLAEVYRLSLQSCALFFSFSCICHFLGFSQVCWASESSVNKVLKSVTLKTLF